MSTLVDEMSETRANEAVEKRLKNILIAKWMCGETFPDTAIVDSVAFCEVIFFGT